MRTLNKIPTGKIARATKIFTVGAKVGVNYIKFYGEKLSGDSVKAKENLDKNNAADIYDGLSELKGSALKMAQMMSMDKQILPKAYTDKFSLAQFSVPPLSAPLVRKTIFKSLGKFPENIFDKFDSESSFAASIGQVHKAEKDGCILAVKIQYPGVADSISSDLALVKPFALKMFNIKSKDVEQYFKEVELKLLEETDYNLELKNSMEMAEACSHLAGVKFPKMFPSLSSDRVLSMEWMEGLHLSEFAKLNTDKDLARKISQNLWDFYMFQFHVLKKMHADPHPGNFKVNSKEELVVLDFGCVKEIPDDFYFPFFELTKSDNLGNPEEFDKLLWELKIFAINDTKPQMDLVRTIFGEMLQLLCEPFNAIEFDFADPVFFSKVSKMGDDVFKNKELTKLSGNRGSEHFLYVNRTLFGLFSLLNELNGGLIKTKYPLA